MSGLSVPPFDETANLLLEAACSSGVQVEQAFVASGPEFARLCRLIAVHLERVEAVPPLPRGPRGAPLGMCAWFPKATFVVTFSDPCAPTVSGTGNLPHPDEIHAYATAFYHDFARIWDAVSSWAEDFQDCDGVVIGDSLGTGPSAESARTIPVSVTYTNPDSYQQ